jgi:hypothetical protein
MLALSTALLAAAWGPLLAWLVWDHSLAAAAVFALLPLAMLALWYRGPRVILAPLAFYLALPFLLHALLTSLTGRAVYWKGRRV